MGQSKINNPETLAILGAQDTGRKKKQTKNTTQHRKLKTRATQTPLKEQVGKILVRNGIKFPTIF
jgi:hypothetical protein